MDFLEWKLSDRGEVGTERRDDLEIPGSALREAVANALVHREYEDPSHRKQPSRIEVYPKSVKITSYGPLVEGVSLEDLNLNPENISPHRRNENIADIFRIAQKVELNASGISRMWEDTLDALLPFPEVTADAYTVSVTFFRRPTDCNSTLCISCSQDVFEYWRFLAEISLENKMLSVETKPSLSHDGRMTDHFLAACRRACPADVNLWYTMRISEVLQPG